MGAAPSGEGGLVGALSTLGKEEKAKVVAAVVELSTRGVARTGGCEAMKRLAEFREETIHVPSSCKRLKVGGGWDSARDVDVDLSAIMYGDGEAEMYRVDFKSRSAPGMTHSGDNMDGRVEGDDETICIDLCDVPAAAQEIFFCLVVFTEGVSFDSIETVHCHLVLDGFDDRLYPAKPAGSKNGFIFGRLAKAGDGWCFQTFGDSRGGCISWLNLKDEIRSLRSRHPVGCPAHLRDWHPLAIDVPRGESKVRVGCGWNCMGDVDVDLSALMFDGGSDEQPLYSLDDNRKKKCPGARHSGDNQRGHGDCDAEHIEVALHEVPLAVERIIFTVTLFQSGVLFQDLDSLWCRVSFGGRQMGRYELNAPPATNGCIFAELRRTPGGWAFVSANVFRGGCKFWTDLREAMRAYRLGTKRAGDALAPAAKRVRRDAGS